MLPVPRKPRASGPPLKNATRWCRCQHQRETRNGGSARFAPDGQIAITRSSAWYLWPQHGRSSAPREAFLRPALRAQTPGPGTVHRGSQSVLDRPYQSGSRVASDRRAPTSIPMVDQAHLALRRLLPIRLGRPRTRLATVAEVNLDRLLGAWFEVARLPNLEADGPGQLSVDVTATYATRPDGRIAVCTAARNARAGMRRTEVNGLVDPADPSGAKLDLRFSKLIRGQLWVIGLDPEYRWVLMGTPSRRRLWLIARAPCVAANDYDRALAIAEAEGFDTARETDPSAERDMKLGQASRIPTPMPVCRSPIGHVLAAVGLRDKRIRDTFRHVAHRFAVAYKNGMPEGPEIRRSADRIAAAINGQTLVDVHFGPQRLRPFEDELTGARVAGVETRGKALLIAFDLGLTLYAHNQLYGVWYVRRRGDLPHTARSLRVALHTETKSAFLHSAPEIALLDAEGLLRHPYLGRLGPDLLDPALHWRDLVRRLNDPALRNRSLAALYLDQGFLAGLATTCAARRCSRPVCTRGSVPGTWI